MTVPRHFRNKPHGSLFRALIGSPGWADALIRYGLPPDMHRLLSDTPVALVERSFIDGALGEPHSDGLFMARLDDGRRCFVLLEHKSTHDLKTPLQMLNYCKGIWRSCAEAHRGVLRVLPMIVTLVIDHGRDRWTADRFSKPSTRRLGMLVNRGC